MSWEEWCDNYYLELLDMTLNKLPESPKKLEEMNETEVNAWLRNIDFTKMICHYRLKTTRHFLGQLHYLRHLAKNLIFLVKIWFSILNLRETKKEFNIKSARERSLLLKSFEEHIIVMKDIEKQMTLPVRDIEETDLEIQNLSDNSEESNRDEYSGNHDLLKTSNEHFDNFFNSLVEKTEEITRLSDESLLDSTIQGISKLTKKLESTRDKFSRRVLHAAVEQGNFTLTNILISSGVNPNSKELCGATPLSLAVLNSDINICDLLITNFAEFKGDMLATFLVPLTWRYPWNVQALLNYSNRILAA